MKPLTGREASILALLAQCSQLTVADRRRILGELNGQALRVAKAMLAGRENGFHGWARGLKTLWHS